MNFIEKIGIGFIVLIALSTILFLAALLIHFWILLIIPILGASYGMGWVIQKLDEAGIIDFF